MAQKKNILILAATREELKGFQPDAQVSILFTGVGIVNSVFSIQKYLSEHKNFDLVIQAGIAGSFSKKLIPGTVVNVVSECFGDIGLEKPAGNINLFESGFDDPMRFPYKNGVMQNDCTSVFPLQLSKVKGLSVAMACGTHETAVLRATRFGADIETMEGASFFYVCKNAGIPFVEIRAVSNYCGASEDAQWDIALAVKNLTRELTAYINYINHEI